MGNYSVVGRYDRDGVGFKKETIHGVYDDTLRKTKRWKTKTWYNIRYKQTQIEIDKKIKLEGWLDGTKIGEYIDDGGMTQDTKDTDSVAIFKVVIRMRFIVLLRTEIWFGQ